MGKPFRKEIDECLATIDWAMVQDTDLISKRIFQDTTKPLLIVGSGGSLSVCHFVASIYQNRGNLAKAVTPLDLFYSRLALKAAKILFISSSGRNNDIQFAFKMAIQNHASDITTICMSKGRPLTKLANEYSVSKGIEFEIPSKKDGFLATNSLTAFFTVLAKASGNININANSDKIKQFVNDEITGFVNQLNFQSAITVLYGGWSTAIAYDIESKFTEAALGSVLLTDYRNFGHGRHHWFAKRIQNSAIIALVTPEEKPISQKTLALIPDSIPRLIISSDKFGTTAAIELLLKSFNLVNSVGDRFNIDPGRPGVPEFGRKLFNLKYSSFYKQSSSIKLSLVEEYSILRKASKSSIQQLQKDELSFWRHKYLTFIDLIEKTPFSSIIFDYDGTLCNNEDRYKESLPREISQELIKLLKAGIIIGIATGRGQSVRSVLRNSNIPKSFWNRIIVGYYNGAFISTLNDDNCPNIESSPNKTLSLIASKIKEYEFLNCDLNLRLRPYQLTIETTSLSNWTIIKRFVQNIVAVISEGEIQLLESSHSIDVVIRNKASKLFVVNRCIELSRNSNCLTIGDKGQWPGNDFELLSTQYSLSVDEVSAQPDSCWNLSNVGIKGVEATKSYLNKMVIYKNYFKMKI